jgi:hypothetical protein
MSKIWIPLNILGIIIALGITLLALQCAKRTQTVSANATYFTVDNSAIPDSAKFEKLTVDGNVYTLYESVNDESMDTKGYHYRIVIDLHGYDIKQLPWQFQITENGKDCNCK